MFLIICWQRIWNIFEEIYLRNKNVFCKQKDAMLREYQSEIEKLKQMIEKGGFEGGEVVPSEVLTQLCWKTQIYWFQSASQYYKCMYPVRYFYKTPTFLLNKISNQLVSKCITIITVCTWTYCRSYWRQRGSVWDRNMRPRWLRCGKSKFPILVFSLSQSQRF